MVQVVLVDLSSDSALCTINAKAADATASVAARGAIARAEALAQLVAESLGGWFEDSDTLNQIWRSESDREKHGRGSVVVPLGALKHGIGRHRNLLFKLLADSLGIKCCLKPGPGEGEWTCPYVNVDGKEFAVNLLSPLPSRKALLSPQELAKRHALFLRGYHLLYICIYQICCDLVWFELQLS